MAGLLAAVIEVWIGDMRKGDREAIEQLQPDSWVVELTAATLGKQPADVIAGIRARVQSGDRIKTNCPAGTGKPGRPSGAAWHGRAA